MITITGLSSSGVPTFTMGQYEDGTTLTQDPSTFNLILTHPDGSTQTFDSNGNLLSTKDKDGYVISYTYTNGLLTTIGDSTGQAIAITYDANGRIQYVAGPNSSGTPMRRVAYNYDSNGLLISVNTQALQSNGTYSTSGTTQYQYNAMDQIAAVIAPDGTTSLTNAADLRGRSTQTMDDMGNMSDYSYTQDATGDRTTQVTDMGNSGINNPTAQGLAALQYIASGSDSTSQFDTSSRTMSTTDALGHTYSYGYTGSSLLPNSVTLPTPGRPSITIQRNAANLPTVINDPANVGGSAVQITYNAANLPVTETDEKGLVTKYTYTSTNNVATITRGFGTSLAETTTYNYDPATHFLTSIVDPLGHTIVSYTYDAQGRVKSEADGTGVTTTYQYDTLGRLIKVFDPTLTGITNFIQYTYNDQDQVTQVTTPTGTITYQYDPTTHRLTSTTDLNGNTTQYTYDAASGNLTNVTQVSSAGNQTTHYDYDRLGNLTLMTAPAGNRTAFRHNVMGDTTGVIEDDNLAPTAQVTSQITSPTTATINVAASEPILVASLTYWLDGQPESGGVTTSVRLNDASTFSFNLTGINTRQLYDYQLTETDRVGLSQSLAPGTFAGDTVAPTATIVPVSPALRNTPVGQETITFSEPVSGVTLSAFKLTLNGGSNLLTGSQTLTTSDNITYTLGNLAGLTTSQGTYTFTLPSTGSGITDLAGNPLSGNATNTFTIDTTAPTVTITPVTPALRNTSVGQVTAVFSKPITGVPLSALSLSLNGGPNLITSSVTVVPDTGNSYDIIGLAGLTGLDGDYVFSINAALIHDLAGNAGTGTSSASWVTDATSPASGVVNSLGADPDQRQLPRLRRLRRPPSATASGVSSLDLYVSVNGGAFTLNQTLNFAPTASGTKTFTFAGQDRNLYAFHSVAHDAAGNTEAKGGTAIEASTTVPDLNPPVTHVLASNPSYSWSPFPASEFGGLTPSSYSNGVFTIRWAGADPDQASGVPAGSIVVVNVYVAVDGGSPTLVGQVNAGSPNGGVYSGSLTYNALTDGVPHNYSFFSVGIDDEQKVQYAPRSRSRPGLLAQGCLIITAAWNVRPRSLNTSGTASRTRPAPSWGPSSPA